MMDCNAESAAGQARPPKPIPLPVIPDQIPDELKGLDQWVCWRYTWDSEAEKWTKCPLNPRTGNKASSTDPKTWTSFDFAYQRYQESQTESWCFHGSGLVLLPINQYVGFDLDHCRDPQTGEVKPWALKVIHQAATYWEYSPSGTGFRGLASGHKPGSRCRNDDIGFEVYSSTRYLCITGHRLPDVPCTIQPIQPAIDAIYHQIFPTTYQSNSQPANGHYPEYSDDLIMETARREVHCDEIIALYDQGDRSRHCHTDGNPDFSRSDAALLRRLAFYSKDDEQLDRLFRGSALNRPKWERRADYRARSLQFAIASTPDHWSGPRRQTSAQSNGQPGDERHTSEHGDIRDEPESEKPPQQLGGVKAKADGYYRVRMIREAWVETRISSFTVKPTLRIWVDGSEAVRANIRAWNNTLAEVTIERHCWHSRGAFLKVLPSLDQWCVATDNEIQAIQALVASQKVPSKRGTRTLGLIDGVWVSDEGIFDASGWIQDPSIVYLPPGGESPLAGRLRYRAQYPSERLSVAQSVYNQVWKLNELTVIGALIGWFFSTPFKPQIHVRLNHFPILNVWGTMGAGKTSLLRLFWKLFGVDSELLACTDTEFSLLSLLSATSSIPLVFDEFKPYDMKPDQVRRFERVLRRVYDGDTEHRGRPDLRLITYRLMAPVAVAGEVSVARQPAMRERIIPVSPSKTWLPEHEEARKAYWELVKLPLHAFASLYIEWSLRQDFAQQWIAAEDALAESVDCEMPERIRDSLRVIAFGLRQFEQFGQAYRLPIPEQLDLSAIFKGILDQLVNADGRARVGLDVLLEHLAAMAEMGRLKSGQHYVVKPTDGQLAIRLDSCLAEYRRYAKDTASDDEVLSKESYLRQLRENHESKGYVVQVSGRAYFGEDQLRAVLISLFQAEASGIDLGGFTRNHD
jgi:hypothetical protein